MSAQVLKRFSCPDGCCTLNLKPYKHVHQNWDFRHKYKNFKAGVFFYDPKTQSVLLVQSRGMKWGPPKGSLEEVDNNSVEDCAIREVYEETGLRINKSMLCTKYKIDRATYFYIEIDSDSNLDIPFTVDNDASGITWINKDCLYKMCMNDELDLNSHCKKLLGKILQIYIKKK